MCISTLEKQYYLWGPCLFRQEPENSLFAQDAFTASISSDMRKELEGCRATDDKYAIVLNRIKKKGSYTKIILKTHTVSWNQVTVLSFLEKE